MFATILGFSVILITFFLNLGYNPFVIVPHSVCCVCSWRTVAVQNQDSLLGVIYPVNGDTIIPCCISPETFIRTKKGLKRIDTLLFKGYSFINGGVPIERSSVNSVFPELSENSNCDNSLLWNSLNKKVIAKIPVVPTLEEYLFDKINKGCTNTNNLREAIDYYAANLFIEMRQANIKFALYNEIYDSNALKSLAVLDSLQDIALDRELKELSTKDMFINNGDTIYRDRMFILEDKHLVDFHCELSRSYLLCLIKDRAKHLDMPAMFTLTNMYLLAYFTEVPCVNFQCNFISNYGANKQEKKIIDEQIKEFGDPYEQVIFSDDILNRKLFAWYNVFNSLCSMDIGWNSTFFSNTMMSHIERSQNKSLEALKIQKEVISELSNIKQELDNADKFMREGLPSDISSSLWLDKLMNYIKLKDSTRYKYKNILEHFNKISFAYDFMNKMEADESFNQLKNKVMDSLLVKMKDHKTGIYNNEFENICKNFILVSMFRMYDIDNDLQKYLEYAEKKDSLFKMTEW